MLLLTYVGTPTTASPSPSPSPPLEPPTCDPRVTLSQMCASLNSVKNQTLSTATTGDYAISDDCLNFQCAFNTTILNADVPINMTMTLLPCTSPYSIELQVVSPGGLGELVNGVYSESSRVPFTLSGFEGAVDITVVQQSYGVTVSVSVCSSCTCVAVSISWLIVCMCVVRNSSVG